jgi:3-dehydroquinate dehydratase / shikimate dehydrogenase
VTYLCVPIFVRDLEQARRDVALATEAGAEMIELRVDDFDDDQAIKRLIDGAGVPCILTCRSQAQGGRSPRPGNVRLASLLAQCPQYIDIELDWNSQAKTPTQPILSHHDFSGRPEKLYNILLEMDKLSVGVNKVVWKARTIRDNLEAFEILQNRNKPTIALCMGEAGVISRILAKKFGAFLTFASLNDESATAPGQVSIDEMKNLYRWDAMSKKTKVYGVIGHPIGHSLSPHIQNAAFAELNHDGIYLPLLVDPPYESFKAFMETFVPFPGLDLSGLSVTIPHKENAARYLKEKGAQIEDLAERIGAVNTIIIDRTGSEPILRGLNTDYAAILDSITDRLAIDRTRLGRLRVAVLGAGGTGRTAVAALAHYGADVSIYNRTREKAEALASEFDGNTGQVLSLPMEELAKSDCDVFINTTSVGMYPKSDQNAWGAKLPKLTPNTVVFDMVYNPVKTRFLAEAEPSGAKTITGVETFVRQAAAQFQAWTNKPAPIELMRRVIENRMSDQKN